MATPELLTDYACQTGEGPLYHPDENRVYWTDIPAGRLFRYDLATGKHEICYEGEPVGGMTLQSDGSLLLFQAKGAVRVWRDGIVKTILENIPEELDNRFNDVIADPEGRVYCGVMTAPSHPGRLYRLDPDGTLTQLLDGIGTSNGMGFTPDGKKMYYTDTRAHRIYLFDYDRATGAITNQRDFVVVPDKEGEGRPDGMTVDAEGNIWGARWDGGCLVRYSPEGVETLRVPFPAKKVSCVTFGGANYDTMFVTTAGGDKKETDGALAGSIFRLKIDGVRGVPEFRSKIGL